MDLPLLSRNQFFPLTNQKDQKNQPDQKDQTNQKAKNKDLTPSAPIRFAGFVIPLHLTPLASRNQKRSDRIHQRPLKPL